MKRKETTTDTEGVADGFTRVFANFFAKGIFYKGHMLYIYVCMYKVMTSTTGEAVGKMELATI